MLNKNEITLIISYILVSFVEYYLLMNLIQFYFGKIELLKDYLALYLLVTLINCGCWYIYLKYSKKKKLLKFCCNV